RVNSSPGPGTLGGLFARYHASPEWINLSPSTRRNYNSVIDYLKPLNDMPLIQVDQEFVYALRDKTMPLHKRGFTNRLLQVLQLIWNWGARRGLCETNNPVLPVERVKKPRGAPVKNRPWTQKELEIVLDAASAAIRVAVALGAYAGLRES